MTASHVVRAVLGYALVVLGVPAAVTLAVVAGVLFAEYTAVLATLSTVAGLLLLIGLFGRVHGARVRLRTALWTRFGCGERRPRTLDEVVEALDSKHPGEVVGGGWGFFLQRRRPKGRPVFLHNFRSTERWEGELWWRAGTTIAEVVRLYEKDENHRTFYSTPTMQYISLGAWLALANHGNGGDAGEPSSYAVEEVVLFKKKTRELVRLTSKQDLRKIFDSDLKKGEQNYVIVLVRFDIQRMVDADEWLRKRYVGVNDAHSAAEWLRPQAALRVLFIGGTRNFGAGIRWERDPDVESDPTLHVDPHFLQRFCMYFQSDVSSAFGGCIEPPPAWNSKMRWVDANRWLPTLPPFFPLMALLLNLVNFELVFFWKGLDGESLARLVDALHFFHRKNGGRSELRVGKTEANAPVFLDVVVRGKRHAPELAKLLRNKIGVTRVALHPGKTRDVDLGTSVSVVPIGEIYFGMPPGASA